MNKSKLFKLAHSIKDKFATFGEALRHAWKVFKLKAQMLTRNVKFQYRKVDGTIRNAVGTLNFHYESKGSGRPVPSDIFMYFDKDANGIRSFKIINLV